MPCAEPILFIESSNIRPNSDEESNDNFPSMKTPEGHRRRSMLHQLTGWWKKKNSYYVDIHHDLQQDNTLFPDEESMGLSENEIFDTTSFPLPPVSKPVPTFMSPRSLDGTPRQDPPVVQSAQSFGSSQTPTNSVSSPPRALYPGTLDSLPTLSESRSGESFPNGNRPTTPRDRQEQPPSHSGPFLFSPPVFPRSSMVFDAIPVGKTTPAIPESSVLNIPLLRTASMSTDSLLSMDSLVNSYPDNDDEDEEDRYLTRHVFLDEHMTFLRTQTEPRSVQVAWDEG